MEKKLEHACSFEVDIILDNGNTIRP